MTSCLGCHLCGVAPRGTQPTPDLTAICRQTRVRSCCPIGCVVAAAPLFDLIWLLGQQPPCVDLMPGAATHLMLGQPIVPPIWPLGQHWPGIWAVGCLRPGMPCWAALGLGKGGRPLGPTPQLDAQASHGRGVPPRWGGRWQRRGCNPGFTNFELATSLINSLPALPNWA